MKKVPLADETDFAKCDDAAFARAVITVHDNEIFDDPLNEAILIETRDRWGDVYEVAVGLITLRNLADRELDRLRSKKDGLQRLGKSGLRQAIAIVDALATGRRHPVYDLIKGIQSKAFRPVRTTPNTIEKMDMDDLVGLVRALKATGLRESAAINHAIDACALTPVEQWKRRIRDWNRRSKDKEPDKIAATITRQAGGSPDRMLAQAASWAAQTFSTPPLPVVKKSPLSNCPQ